VLYWLDILGNKLHRFDPRNRSNLSYDVGESVSSVVLSLDSRLLLGLRSGIGWLDRDTGRLQHIVDPEPQKPHTRMNDGKCDPLGRFWVGSYCERAPEFDGALYCLHPDFKLETKLSGIQCSNGPAWSADGKSLYYVDSARHTIWGFDYDAPSGTMRGQRVVASIDPSLGSPDGITVDSQGKLWVAVWGGARVMRLDPTTGKVELEVPIPARHVSSVAFGGEDLDVLYVTTARVGRSPEELSAEPLAGSLFRVRLPYQGVVASRFGAELGKLKEARDR
jgi:sugar lactone lactonase YvrE